MITLIDDSVPSFVSGHDVVSGRLLSWWNAYKGTSIAQFYQTEHAGCIGVLDTTAIVCIPDEDREEVSAFLALQSHLKTVYTNVPSIVGGKENHFTAMRLQRPLAEQPLTSVNLETLYRFLTPYFADLPPFESWYLDVSYRTRHGQCHHTAIQQEGRLASSAMSVAEWDVGALLGAVATSPEYRRKGYAGQCVSALAGTLQAKGKTIWICPYNERARQLYLSLGFEDQGQVTMIERT